MSKKLHVESPEKVKAFVYTDKIYLCSFMRSGNSWLRYCLEAYGNQPTHSVYAKPQHDESILFGFSPDAKIVKSHENAIQYDNVIFLYRHPFDVMLSWAIFDYGTRVLASADIFNAYLLGSIYAPINQMGRYVVHTEAALSQGARNQINITWNITVAANNSFT